MWLTFVRSICIPLYSSLHAEVHRSQVNGERQFDSNHHFGQTNGSHSVLDFYERSIFLHQVRTSYYVGRARFSFCLCRVSQPQAVKSTSSALYQLRLQGPPPNRRSKSPTSSLTINTRTLKRRTISSPTLAAALKEQELAEQYVTHDNMHLEYS